jgi:alpha-galactosidase
MPGKQSDLKVNDKVYSGDYLMKIGLDVLKAETMRSTVIELIAE